MATRKFLSNRLLEVENLLNSVGSNADRLSLDVGDHSDEIHWDKALAGDATGWINEIHNLRNNLVRAESLLHEYEVQRKTNLGE